MKEPPEWIALMAADRFAGCETPLGEKRKKLRVNPSCQQAFGATGSGEVSHAEKTSRRSNGYRVCSVVCAEFAQDVCHVSFHRLVDNRELCSYLFV